MNPVEDLYARLKKHQEPKGLFFNKDREMVMQLLESLLINKERFGYMSCPCRLGSGTYELDRDILCPCVYSKQDIQEYGSCFCGLYVSRDWNEDRIPHAAVPERRPLEKIMAGLGLEE